MASVSSHRKRSFDQIAFFHIANKHANVQFELWYPSQSAKNGIHSPTIIEWTSTSDNDNEPFLIDCQYIILLICMNACTLILGLLMSMPSSASVDHLLMFSSELKLF